MNLVSQFRERNFAALAEAVRDRWGLDASEADLACLYALAFENDPPVAGGNDKEPWSDHTWLLWLRNRLGELATTTREEVLRKWDWSVGPAPVTVDQWKSFLSRLSAALLSDAEIREQLDNAVIARDWLGFPPAAEEQVSECERRIGMSLPPSYRSFFLASNGWHTTGWQLIRVLPCQEISWLRDSDPGLIATWCENGSYDVPDEEYFVYDDSQDCCNLRPEYLRDMLLISTTNWTNVDYFFLNPRVVFDDGEWEAWHFSADFPGADRFQSFGRLMNSQYAILKQG